MTDQTFQEWVILEVMGRLRLAGSISEQTIAGAGMVRIDVPETKHAPAFTRFFAPGSIYSITPTTEEIARHLAERFREVPVTRFELPQLAAPAPSAPSAVGAEPVDQYAAEEDDGNERDDDFDEDEVDLPF